MFSLFFLKNKNYVTDLIRTFEENIEEIKYFTKFYFHLDYIIMNVRITVIKLT